MTIHLYFSLTPEALIASMLPPDEFGRYQAVGRMLKIRGQSLFFELDPEFRDPYFPIDEGYSRCIPHADGLPKNSVYISTYRVLEHIPPSAIQKLYLTTATGAVLGLEACTECPDAGEGLHLYQELVPVSNLVASLLPPKKFYESITTDPLKLVSFPGLAFVELELGELAKNPEFGSAGDLPYTFISHLRECLMDLKLETKQSKMVNRLMVADFPYRTISTGFYVGNGAEFKFFPMPSRDLLRQEQRVWWRSANRVD